MAEERPIFSKAQVQDTLRTRDAIKDIQAFHEKYEAGYIQCF